MVPRVGAHYGRCVPSCRGATALSAPEPEDLRVTLRSAWTPFAVCFLALLAAPAGAAEFGSPGKRVVYLAGAMPDEGLVAFSVALAASGEPGVLLLDSTKATPYIRSFLDAYRPERIVPVGTFPDGIAALARRLGRPVEAPLPCGVRPGAEVWKR